MIPIDMSKEYRMMKNKELMEDTSSRSISEANAKIAGECEEIPLQASARNVVADNRTYSLDSCGMGAVAKSASLFVCNPPSINRDTPAQQNSSNNKMNANERYLSMDFKLNISSEEDQCPISKFYRLL